MIGAGFVFRCGTWLPCSCFNLPQRRCVECFRGGIVDAGFRAGAAYRHQRGVVNDEADLNELVPVALQIVEIAERDFAGAIVDLADGLFFINDDVAGERPVAGLQSLAALRDVLHVAARVFFEIRRVDESGRVPIEKGFPSAVRMVCGANTSSAGR